MTVVIGAGLSLSGAVIGNDANGNNPIIGYRNLVTTINISADTEDADHPAVNLANPATHLFWRGVDGSPITDDHIVIVLDSAELVDYVGVARHNFGSGLIPVSIEGQSTFGGSWDEIVTELMLPNDGPALFRFAPQALYAIRIRMQYSMATVPALPQAAVVYVGALLVLQRRIYVGHTPIPMGRVSNIVTGRSESGEFLGRILLSTMVQTQIQLANLLPGWYRTYMDPFIEAAIEGPFFFAWRPSDYPFEVGYCWMTDNAQPSNQRSNGMMQVAFNVSGIAEVA